jgi:hypothetical protein
MRQVVVAAGELGRSGHPWRSGGCSTLVDVAGWPAAGEVGTIAAVLYF